MRSMRRIASADVSSKPVLLPLALAALAVLAVAACSSDEKTATTATQAQKVTGTVSLEGSSTVQPFSIDLIDAFKKKYPDVTVNPPSGKGSGAGITAFINKQVDIAQSSRKIKDDEVNQ